MDNYNSYGNMAQQSGIGTGMLLFFGFIILLLLVINILFTISVYRFIKTVPSDKRIFPAYFAWLVYIPIAGIVFMWLAYPFAVGKSAKNINSVAGNSLFGLGLAYVILMTLTMLLPFLSLFIFIPIIIIWIIFWVKTVSARKELVLKATKLEM